MLKDPSITTKRTLNLIHLEVKTLKTKTNNKNGIRKSGKVNGTKRTGMESRNTKIKTGRVITSIKIKITMANIIKMETHLERLLQNKTTMEHNKKERSIIKVKESMDVGSNKLF